MIICIHGGTTIITTIVKCALDHSFAHFECKYGNVSCFVCCSGGGIALTSESIRLFSISTCILIIQHLGLYKIQSYLKRFNL